MKKALKILLGVLIVIIILMGTVVAWQWENIQSIMLGINENYEEIEARKKDADSLLFGSLNDFLDEGLREPTEDELKLIKEGKLTMSELYSNILAEKNNGETTYDEKEDKFEEPEIKEDEKLSKDEIINKYIAQLYALETAFEARSEALITEAAYYYEGKKKEMSPIEARANTITTYTSKVRKVQSDCDSKVEKVIDNLKKDLKKIGEDTGIVETVKKAYADKKQLKLSYYANRYLK